jgi:radical SAM protein with 4Fe4S-binding SPASM domain
VINSYPRQHYSTLFNQSNGFFLRIEDDGYKEPFWSPYGPELIDISITNWCDQGCKFCYKKSNSSGRHMNVEDYRNIVYQATHMKVSQIALGGGNPNQHPDFCEILRLTREEFDIVPSYTTNGEGLSSEVVKATKMFCGSVAVSAYAPYYSTRQAVSLLTAHNIRTNIHFLLMPETIDTAIQWLETYPDFFHNINALIFLNYKPVGKNINDFCLANSSSNIGRLFELINRHHSFKIGFDSCSISGIVKYVQSSPLAVEPCEAGRFSMFISEDMKMYPCSFMIEKYQGVHISDNNIQKEWVNNNLFINIRNKIRQGCNNICQYKSICSGGCPIFPEINFCRYKFSEIS